MYSKCIYLYIFLPEQTAAISTDAVVDNIMIMGITTYIQNMYQHMWMQICNNRLQKIAPAKR